MTFGAKSFWEWAVKAYGGEGVAAACLSLQDESGQNVPLLLWAVWLASQDIELGESQAADAVALARSWSDELIVPLRLLRRRLKMEVSTDDAALRLPLREKIKAIELEAERALMTKLAMLESGVNTEVNQNVKDVVIANLRAVSREWNEIVPEAGLSRLSEALSEGRFLRYKG